MREILRFCTRSLSIAELYVAGHIYMCRAMGWRARVSDLVMLLRNETSRRGRLDNARRAG